ncbi:unnamed protein product [Spodoptera exigua]|nr:unnamed protein product [Spodoptera exigua]
MCRIVYRGELEVVRASQEHYYLSYQYYVEGRDSGVISSMSYLRAGLQAVSRNAEGKTLSNRIQRAISMAASSQIIGYRRCYKLYIDLLCLATNGVQIC